MGKVNYEKWYRALRDTNPEAFQKAISYMEGVTLNHDTPTKAAAEYEVAAVMLACELLGVHT